MTAQDIAEMDLAEWRRAMEGVTPGPWCLDGHNLSAVLHCVTPKGHPDAKHLTGDYVTVARCENTWRADASWIVRCSPAGISALLDALEAMGCELAEAGAGKQRAIDGAREAVLSMMWMPGVRAALDQIPEDDPLEPWVRKANEADGWEARAIAAERALSESQAEGRRKDERIEEAETVLHGLFRAPVHVDGCLHKDNARLPCQCGAHDRYRALEARAHKLLRERDERAVPAAQDEGDGHG